MTIKRQLFISNTLMVLIPTLTMILLTAAFIFFLNTSGLFDLKQLYTRDLFGGAVRELNELNDGLGASFSETELKNGVDSFNDKYKSGITLYVYEGGTAVFAELDLGAAGQSFLDSALKSQSESIAISESGAIFCLDNGAYRFVLLDTNYSSSNIIDQGQNLRAGFWIMLAATLIVLFVDWLLTKQIIKSITTPINVLKKGVREIGEGNLDYRIKYNNDNEFNEICSDFNKMAMRLQSHVEQRRKDEDNRKELIAGISHDLRTPLTSIKAYLEGIEKGVASTPEQKQRYFDMVKKKSIELEHTINQLFLFSKIDIGEFPFYIESVDIVSLLKDYFAAVADEYDSKGLSIYFSFKSEQIYVDIDVTQIKNTLTNILENSLKYKNKEKGRIDVTYALTASQFVLRLADDGPGVDADSLGKLFDVFYRGDYSRQSKGSGLGLAIAAKTMERLNGSIRAENGDNGKGGSSESSGLIIELMLPFKHEEQQEWEKA